MKKLSCLLKKGLLLKDFNEYNANILFNKTSHSATDYFNWFGLNTYSVSSECNQYDSFFHLSFLFNNNNVISDQETHAVVMRHQLMGCVDTASTINLLILMSLRAYCPARQ
jgi:hypothetical protein